MKALSSLSVLIISTLAAVASGQDDDSSFLRRNNKQQQERELIFCDKDENNVQNWCRTPGTGGSCQELFRPKNSVGGSTQDQDFSTGLQQLVEIVEQAESQNKRVRAYGSKFSLTNILYTPDYMVETWGLNYCKIGIDNNEHVHTNYQAKKDRLVFVQSGVMVKDLFQVLLEEKLTLATALNPDGTRFVGAVATGSHAANNQVGSIQDIVKGIDLVLPGEDRHVFLQRSSDPVVTDTYTQDALGNATLLTDDDKFNAALVSFGCMGLIHGMLVETVPIFKLKSQTKQLNYDDIRDKVLTNLDVTGLGFEGVTERPEDIWVGINAFRRRKNTFVTILQRVEVDDAQAEIRDENALLPPQQNAFQREEPQVGEVSGEGHLSSSSSSLLNFFSLPRRFLYGIILNTVMKGVFRMRDNGKIAYPHEWFTIAGTEDPSASFVMSMNYELEVFVSIDRAAEVADLMGDVMRRTAPFGSYALRFLKPTNATLGPSKFGELTAAIAMLGLYRPGIPLIITRRLEKAFQLFYKEMAASGIPHVYHWGKMFPVNDEWAQSGYGDALGEWQSQRADLLGNHSDMFSNDLMEKIGVIA